MRRAASVALDRVDRVAIIDGDLHHGNGTQKIFYTDDQVLYCSIHQGNIFPHTGWLDEIGSGKGKGFTINALLRSGSTISDYRCIFEQVFVPALEKFKPDVVIVSAGQDVLADDPKSGTSLFSRDFGVLTRIVQDSTEHPLALVLEGGYGPSHGGAVTSLFSARNGTTSLSELEGKPHRTMQEIISGLAKLTA